MSLRYDKSLGLPTICEEVASPLHHLTQRAVEFNWKENCQHSFQVLKNAFTQAPVLCHLSFKKEFNLVECHITQEAQRQNEFHDCATKSRSFTVGDAVCLAGKRMDCEGIYHH